MIDLFCWGSPVEQERRIRIRLTIAAYCYEVLQQPIMSDGEFDTLALQSDPTIKTGHLDNWWPVHFVSYSGSWIHAHPELDKVRKCAQQVIRNRSLSTDAINDAAG